MKFYFTGDLHGNAYDFLDRVYYIPPDEEAAIVILGDAGFNYYLGLKDTVLKNKVSASNVQAIYCVRGNHEERPENCENIVKIFDESVGNAVYYDPNFPKIKYLLDGRDYMFNNVHALVIGGAYSVDKFYRLAQGWRWFPEEQLSEKEKYNIMNIVRERKFDLVLTHTCPYDWRPTDLFLTSLDQSMVDSSMELWLQDIENSISYKRWLFGHYHDDRIVNDKAIMLYEHVVSLENAMEGII